MVKSENIRWTMRPVYSVVVGSLRTELPPSRSQTGVLLKSSHGRRAGGVWAGHDLGHGSCCY